MSDRSLSRGMRGQVYTLESVLAAIIVLTAVLFALQAMIITPTTSGSVDPSVRTELRQQADDILMIAAQNETNDLSTMVRDWDQTSRTFTNATNPEIGYGMNDPKDPLGTMLNETFAQQSRLYNVEVVYQGRNVSDGQGSIPMVYRGTPGDGAVVSSYTLTLYDNQTLTSPYANNAELWEYDTDMTDNDDGYYPIPNAVDGPVYNVVQVRVVVW